MARIRSVHPEICTDETLVGASAEAERTFVRLWPHLDDDGRTVDNVKLLKAALYPLHDSVSAEDVDADLEELVGLGLVLRYEVDGKRYLAAKQSSWSTYQRPRHPTPSKLPPPPAQGAVVLPTVTADRRNPPAEPGAPAVTAPRRSPTAGVEWSGVDVGEGGGAEPPQHPATYHALLPPGASATFLAELDQIIDALIVVYGEQVDEAVLALLDRGVRFQFPSRVRQALEAGMTPPASVRPSALDAAQEAQRALMARDRSCPACSGSGWGDPDEDTGVALPCRTCRPEDARFQEAS